MHLYCPYPNHNIMPVSLVSGTPYPCDDGGEQLQKRGESFQLSLGDAPQWWVTVLCCVWIWDVSS